MYEASFELFRLVLYATAGLTFLTGVLVWLNRPATGARTLAILLLAVTVWLLCLAVASIITDVGTTVSLIRIIYTVAGVTILSLFVFLLEYTGRDRFVTPRTIGVLSIEPALLTVLVWTTSYHDLLWGPVVENPSYFVGIDYTLGPLFWAHVIYSYGLLLVGAGLLFAFLRETAQLYRNQGLALVLGIIAPWAGNAIWIGTSSSVGGLTGERLSTVIVADTTALGFAVSGIVLAWAVTRAGLTDLTPIARAKVVETMNAGVLVVDRHGRILDSNSTSDRIFASEFDSGGDTVDLIGKQIDGVFEPYPSLSRLLEKSGEGVEEMVIETDKGRRYFAATVTRLDDDRELGRLIVVHDITDQKRRQRELERQNEQLEGFANVVSHDLRNPLNVATGFVDVMAETDEVRNVERVQTAHRRMHRIVQDVLEFARQGQSITDVEPVGVCSVAEDAWETVETHDATLECTAGLTILADRRRLQRLLENLFRNAIEHNSTYNDRDGHHDDACEHGDTNVTVTVGGFGGFAESMDTARGFYVADDGVGIPPQKRESVFEAGWTDKTDGTGLGLAIVDGIARGHGWEVSIGESSDGGAQFEFRGVALADDRADERQNTEEPSHKDDQIYPDPSKESKVSDLDVLR